MYAYLMPGIAMPVRPAKGLEVKRDEDTRGLWGVYDGDLGRFISDERHARAQGALQERDTFWYPWFNQQEQRLVS